MGAIGKAIDEAIDGPLADDFAPHSGTPFGEIGPTHRSDSYSQQVYPLQTTSTSALEKLQQMEAYKMLDGVKDLHDTMQRRGIDLGSLPDSAAKAQRDRFFRQNPGYVTPVDPKQNLGSLYYSDNIVDDKGNPYKASNNQGIADHVADYNRNLPSDTMYKDYDKLQDEGGGFPSDEDIMPRRQAAKATIDKLDQMRSSPDAPPVADELQQLIPKVASKTATREEYLRFYSLMGTKL